ncbi:MAG: hypothetical protein ABR958_05110 [Dehalococcoidales bacterium]
MATRRSASGFWTPPPENCAPRPVAGIQHDECRRLWNWMAGRSGGSGRRRRLPQYRFPGITRPVFPNL